MAAGSTQFRTFQNVQAYEDALARHAQWVRWTRALYCPCVQARTRQADPKCNLCKGRGRIYKTPGVQNINYETARHDSNGKVYPLYTPVVGTPVVIRQGVELVLAGSQPPDGSYIQVDPPYPKAWQEVFVTYQYSPLISVVDEDSAVVDTNTLRTIATRFAYRGKSFEGSIDSVSRVYNVDKDKTYTVVVATKEYIYLAGMDAWSSGDVLEVDYEYVKPFQFLLLGISEKLRYERPYILENAQATLVTPYWAKPAPDDLFTMLSGEQYGSVVIDPTHSVGADVVRNYYDLDRLVEIIDVYGKEYVIGTDVELFGRNEIKWNIAKPTGNYSVQFTYHPTYIALVEFPTIRNAENKSFVNRIQLMQYDHTSDKVQF